MRATLFLVALLVLVTEASSDGGAMYIRWGKNSCSGSYTDLVYAGIAGGSSSSHKGSGSNYLCLPKDPDWSSYDSFFRGTGGILYGAEYRMPSTSSNFPFSSPSSSNPLNYQDVPCAVCRARARESTLMIPGKTRCYSGWTEEYDGYLMTQHYSTGYRTEFVCVDEHPEVDYAGQSPAASAYFYPVEASCGSLPCPPYVHGREITCVVCTK